MLHSWSIGNVAIQGRTILAPLSGVTDLTFRQIAKRFGAALVVSEMVASDGLVHGSEEARLRSDGAGITPHVIQLAGRTPYWMAEGARVAEASGAAIIDINMGCPAKKVTGGYSGSALMRDLPLATDIIAATVAACSVPVTVKMRLGWDCSSINAPELARRAQDLGAQAITVHGRTRQQFYKGQADWNAIAEISEALDIPVIANGDISSEADARACMAAAKTDFVMIGRASMGRPWLVGQIGAALDKQPVPMPTPEERALAACEHYEGLLSSYGPRIAIKHARKHLAAYADIAVQDGFLVSDEDRRELVISQDPKRVFELLSRLFSQPGRKAA
ncbi:tRNA dihydrouridine synthase DusB [Microvirga sp. W0021]|uniref:tRNA-dihydrouridine synthase n=1 Tax=Hohaiivirga grylli TaxID=3133970 RepID=A0ABV0BKQ0_9HYPH